MSQLGIAVAVAAIQGLLVLGAHAQARDQQLADFAQDLAALHDALPRPPDGQVQAMYSSAALDELWQTVIVRAGELKRKWQENPYVEVIGFSVSLGYPPSIDVQFQFKE